MDDKSQMDAAGDLIREIVATKQHKLDEFTASHAEDMKSFQFECKRHGDFLALFVTRGSSKIVAAVNLMASPAIGITNGAPPDMGGTVRFARSWNAAGDGVAAIYEGSAYPRSPHLRLHQQASTDTTTQMMVLSGHHYHDPLSGIYVRDAPRRARDDMVTFANLGELSVPCGCGSDVFASTMIECGLASARK